MKLNISKIFLVLISFMSFSCYAESDYPKTKEEKVSDRMGSIVGDEGIVFKPFHAKNDSTKSNIGAKVNRFLWDGSKDVLKFMPFAVSDVAAGLLITDWYSTEDQPNYSFKIQVTIKDNVISTEAIDVTVYEKKLKNNQWYNLPLSSKLSANFSDKIIRKARELYIKETEEK